MSFIEDIILRDDKRGISALRHALPEDYCTEAASYLLANPGRIVIVTGFKYTKNDNIAINIIIGKEFLILSGSKSLKSFTCNGAPLITNK